MSETFIHTAEAFVAVKKKDAINIADPFPNEIKAEVKEITYLYFAYGSNMDKMRLVSRIGNVEVVDTKHTLQGYKLVFNAGVEGLGTFANLVKTGNYEDFVEGIIYSLSKSQIRALDAFEGAPYAYNRVIERYKKKNLIIYISLNESYRNTYRMQTHYAQYLINGVIANDFTHTANIIIEHMRTAPVYIPPKRTKRKRKKKE